MARPRKPGRVFAGPRTAVMLIAGLAGAALAALAGMAIARPFTLGVGQNVKVAHAKREAIVVNGRGVAVYYLSPETIHHPLCTQANGCFSFWPPVKVASAKAKLSKASGIKGKLGVWHRDGFIQVTLGGHPLYTFLDDHGKKGVANGNKVVAFGGTWHVIKASSRSPGTSTSPPTSSTSSTSSTTSSTSTTSTTSTNPYG